MHATAAYGAPDRSANVPRVNAVLEHQRCQVAIRGTTTGLGRRVAERLGRNPVTDIASLSETSTDPAAARDHTDVIVDVVLGDYDDLARRRRSVTEVATELVASADRVGADHLVVVSSAMVYGAMPNNPVPLTEDAVLRPDPVFAYARQLATAELILERWRIAVPGRRVCILRPVVMMAAGETSSLARALAAGFGRRFAGGSTGAQFVHLDDVAAAIECGVLEGLDGVYNVAPEGWVPAERVLALTGDTMRIPLPERWAEVVEGLRWRLQRGPIPPGLRAYTTDSWFVANDKLRSVGWTARVTNEQTYVEGTEGAWWTTISPKRRQEFTLGAAITVVLAGLAAAVTLGWWWRSRRR